MNVKCQQCGKVIDRSNAYKVTVGKVNKYYCNEEEYNTIKAQKDLKDNTYEKIFECFNRKITNSILFKEIGELEKIYGYKKITGYINENLEFLSNILCGKTFVSEFAQIKYFSAILKNNLADYSVKEETHVKAIEIDIPNSKYKERKRKRCLDEIEEEVGE